jgi:tetratricopeptide (TPR) repeat protein
MECVCHIRFAWVLSLGIALLATPLLAQPTPSTQQAVELSQKAVTFFNAGDYNSALALFQRAYQLSNSPSLLYSSGRCHQKLGDEKAAREAFCSYLSTSDTMRRTEANSALKEITPPGEEPCPVVSPLTPTIGPDETANPTSAPAGNQDFLKQGKKILLDSGHLLKAFTIQNIIKQGKALPYSLFLVGSVAGASALLLSNCNDCDESTKKNHTAGVLLALTADLSFVTGGITLIRARKKKVDTAPSLKQNDATTAIQATNE